MLGEMKLIDVCPVNSDLIAQVRLKYPRRSDGGKALAPAGLKTMNRGF